MDASAAILALLGIPVLVTLSALWRGFALSVLWGWFIVPLFGAPVLSIPFAIGISLIVGFLTHHHTEKDPELGRSIAIAVVGPAIALLAGWIVTKFI